MKLTEEQREILIEALIDDWMEALQDSRDMKSFLYEIFRYGRDGYEDFEDEALVKMCEDADLEDALECLK